MTRLRRWLFRGIVTVFALGLLIQLVPYGRDHVNPPVFAEPAWDSPATRALAKRACFDCHSNETRWPAYANVAPVSWLVQRDVTEGRAALNFSEWHRAQKESHEAAEAVREGEMPMAIYTLMHPSARLSAEERTALAQGLTRTIGVSRRDHGALSGQ